MPKNIHINNTLPINKTTKSVGTRGESALARNRSGNHGHRAKSNRRPKNQH